MKILISSDSVCDLPAEVIKNNNIKILPLPITLGDELYLDGDNINSEIIFDFVEKNKTLPKTSAINEYDYAEFFKNNLKEYDKIIHFVISDKISLCYENAKAAAKEMSDVYIVNSATLSSAVGLLIMYACSLRDKGLSADEIYKKVMEKVHKTYIVFVIEKLDYLYKGGRCSSLQRLGANLLKLRPSVYINNGKLEVHKKYRGKMPEVVKNFIIDTINENQDYDDEICFITYSSATEEMIQSAHNTLKLQTRFKNILESCAGATITSHCGKNTIGIAFFKK